jgi:pseudouridine kinase
MEHDAAVKNAIYQASAAVNGRSTAALDNATVTLSSLLLSTGADVTQSDLDALMAERRQLSAGASEGVIAAPEAGVFTAAVDGFENLTPDALEEKLPLLRAAGALVLDTNIPEETVRWLCTQVDVPIFADPVSVSKAEKLRPVLARLHALKPNKLEAELLSGIRIADEHDLNRAADALLETGLQQVYITMGKEGVLAADGKKRLRLSALPEVPVNTTGCGDAFMAALVWAHFRGLDAAESARAGLAAAAIAMAGRETVNPAMCEEKLLQKMKQPQ